MNHDFIFSKSIYKSFNIKINLLSKKFLALHIESEILTYLKIPPPS